MRISPHWLKSFVDIPVDERSLADALTLAGASVESISAVNGKTIYEMDITTNRPDVMNHYGIAREISAIYNTQLQPITSGLPKPTGKSSVSVTIDNPELCARFTGQEIRNVEIGPSKGEVLERFRDLEQKPINNAADATNYVLLMMGKPSHAFDADKLAGARIIVRNAHPGESLRTLDGVERKLHPEDLVIADLQRPVALAGVMGGWDSMISASTRNIFIESAWFDPVAIRKTSRRHAIHTDASHRFERGADWASTVISTELVAKLILEYGGELTGDIVDVIARQIGHPPIRLRLSEVKRILGKQIGSSEIERMLRKLGFTLKQTDHGVYTVGVPTWRLDVEREIDVIEEIARVHGYDKFPNTLPAFSQSVIELPTQEKDGKLRSTLLALGYNEALSSTFIAREESQRFSSASPVIIANPLSEEASAMRTSLVPGMLDMIARNLNHSVESVRLFEHGHVYAMYGAAADEHDSLCLAATTSAISSTSDPQTIFRSFKGDVEGLLRAFNVSLEFDPNAPDYFHTGRKARGRLNGRDLVHFGQVHPQVAASRKFKQDVYLAEVFIEHLHEVDLRLPRYQRPSLYPSVERDFSFLFDESVSFEQVMEAVTGMNIVELKQILPREIFRGGPIPVGKYSLLLRATFQSNHRTLRDEEVNAWSAGIIDKLKSLGGRQR